VAAIAQGCAAAPILDAEAAANAESIELLLDANSGFVEVEYHVSPDQVPAPVLAAMDALHPGGKATAAERELVGTTLYWEVTKRANGREVEAMFLPDGTLYQQEIEIAATDVPEEVRAAFRDRMGVPAGKWEEIRDGAGARTEFHAKARKDDKAYKVVIGLDGTVLAVFREVPAEIEVPVGA
jgi:hypothetical protein